MSFHVRDIYLPGPAEFLEQATEDTEVVGTVLGFSDSGSSPSVFAIVQTDHDSRVLVPVSRLSTMRRLQLEDSDET